jgi:CBS domain-containing protein
MDEVKRLIKGKALVHVAPVATVAEAAAMMSQERIGAVLILDNGRLCGIFTERDLLNRVVAPGLNPQVTPISDVMTSKVAVARADESYGDCMEKMKKVGCRHLPVVDNDRLLGIISIRDLLMHDISVKNDEIRMMNYLYYYTPPDMEH